MSYAIMLEQFFDASLEQVIDLMAHELESLQATKPSASLSVTVDDVMGKKVWKGQLIEINIWGSPNIDYGYIEIAQVYNNSDTPVRVRLYASSPNFTAYWATVGYKLKQSLPLSDGSPGPTNEPWNLIEDKSYHRKMLKLWHEGLTAHAIGERLDLAQSTVYEQLGILRKKYGMVIVPYKHPARKNPSIP